MNFEERELYLNPDHKKLGGVCTGRANYLNVPGICVRVAAVIALVVHPLATLLT